MTEKKLCYEMGHRDFYRYEGSELVCKKCNRVVGMVYHYVAEERDREIEKLQKIIEKVKEVLG